MKRLNKNNLKQPSPTRTSRRVTNWFLVVLWVTLLLVGQFSLFRKVDGIVGTAGMVRPQSKEEAEIATQHVQKERIDLFVAIGSGPGNAELRNALRETWIRDLINSQTNNNTRMEYRIFVDPNVASSQDSSRDDMVEMPVEGGYQHFAARAFYQFQYAVEHFDFDYYLRVDDDGYLCTAPLLWELDQNAPKRQFFWGKYFCEEGKRVADENFMLFSRDMVDVFLQLQPVALTGPPDATFAALFGMWQNYFNLTIWDDRKRIDAQQGYTTHFMHTRKGIQEGTPAELQNFCPTHVWAHHVKSIDTIRSVHAHSTTTKVDESILTKGRQGLVPNQICDGRRFSNILDPKKTSLKGGSFPRLQTPH